MRWLINARVSGVAPLGTAWAAGSPGSRKNIRNDRIEIANSSTTTHSRRRMTYSSTTHLRSSHPIVGRRPPALNGSAMRIGRGMRRRRSGRYMAAEA